MAWLINKERCNKASTVQVLKPYGDKQFCTFKCEHKCDNDKKKSIKQAHVNNKTHWN